MCAGSFTKHHINAVNDNMVCDQSVCSIYLHSLGSRFYSKNFDYENWKNLMNFDSSNLRIGGKICGLLTLYGWSILVPILLNMAFQISTFHRDFKDKKVSGFEFLSVIILCYPQWRCIKTLVNFFYHKDETKLQTEKRTYERDLETLEAFTEAGIQVGISISYFII